MSRLAVAALLAALSAGCDGARSKSCTLIGCQSGLEFTLPALAMRAGASALPLTVRACLDASCAEASLATTDPGGTCGASTGGVGATLLCRVDADGTLGISLVLASEPAAALQPGDGHAAALRVAPASGAAVVDDTRAVSLTALRPNGPDCEPLCLEASIRFDP